MNASELRALQKPLILLLIIVIGVIVRPGA